MLRSSGPMALLICGILLLSLSATLLPSAAAQDATPPVITDITEGEPVVGENFTIAVRIASDYDLYRVQFYIYFTYIQGSSPLQNVMLYAADYPPGTRNFETTTETPLNATQLNYQITVTDTASFMPKVTDVISRPVLDNIPPTAHCDTPIALDMEVVYTFNGSASTDNVGIANYTWTFQYGGAPIRLYGPSPTFNFTAAGQYAGTLAVKDFDGNSDSAAFQVVVGDSERPVAHAGVQMLITAGEHASFDGSGSSDNVEIVNYTWAFVHNGTQVLLYGVSPSFVFWTPGVYEVALTVMDAAGHSDTALLSVQVLEESSGEGGFLPWWAYVLLAMICVFMVLGYFILRD